MNTICEFFRRRAWLRVAVVAWITPSLLFLPGGTRANPSGGIVTSGAVEFGDGLGGHLQLRQSTDKAIINWEEFSISAGEITEFLQPGASSAVLNRVVSGNPSAIQGALRANGKVFVINPNGIVVGTSGTIDVAGLVLSTLDVSDAEFLSGGDMIFRGNGN
ncbi:MAG: filamentous hemagglutinin N-terminal domain-containing protein, partial [Verrucomicrobiae bacterium]|nr:filamentous hemagglutinin N-terminal domain-containing protein [Verrucomicrobiae bacterium]